MKSVTPMKGTWVRNTKGKIGLIEDGSPRTLHAFSGKAGRHDGLAQLLLKDNTQCQEIDTVIHASRHDLLCDIIHIRPGPPLGIPSLQIALTGYEGRLHVCVPKLGEHLFHGS